MILTEGFRNRSKRPHVPTGDKCPELTDYEWGRLKKDLAHNVEMAKQYKPQEGEQDEQDVS